MDDNNLYCGQNTGPYTASDDSYSYPPVFPWNPSTTYKRKKSRLGTHRKERGVLKDLINVNVLPEEPQQTPDLKPASIVTTPSFPTSQPNSDFRLFQTSPMIDFPQFDILSLNSKTISPIENDIFSTLEQNSISPVPEPSENTPAPEKREKTPKKEVRFVEPPLPEKYSSSRKCPKIPQQFIVKGKSYQVVGELGRGGSSTVYEVKHPEINEALAVKRVTLSKVDENIAEGYLHEVEMLEKLQNCNAIIRMLDHELVYEDDEKFLYVVMEKGDYDFKKIIIDINKNEKLDILAIIKYWHQMLTIVYEIHCRDIIHSDLKPANFVSVKDKLKLIDFGIASSMQADMTSVYKDVFTGTLDYMSPEAISIVKCPSGHGYKISRRTDVWALGCILYKLIYGKLPFQHIKQKWPKLNAIASLDVPVEFPEKEGVPLPLIESLKSCLVKDQKKRPNVGELLKDLTKITVIDLLHIEDPGCRCSASYRTA